ncbi:MAG TPA: hypothetical protein VMI30_03190, partial [Stellaceae bacterium]|nr:hypothetical protein [Stellaceae bacterium]
VETTDNEPGGLMRFLPLAAAIVAGIALAGAAGWFGFTNLRRRAKTPTAGVVAPATDATEQSPVKIVLSPVLPLRRRASRPATLPPALVLPPPPTDLNAVLAPLERRIRQLVRGKVRCRYSLLTGLWPCRTESGAVAAAVLDLVAAAAKVMDADGTLIVGTRNFTFDAANIADYPGGRLGRFARITVRDNGPGLTDAGLDTIADPEKSVRPAIARTAVVMERLGGFLRVESAEGVGTAVHLYFAQVQPASEPSEPVPAAQVAE